MAVYKIPQNVEAEDKLLGPFTFKQFIFMMIAAMAGMFAWFLFQIRPVLATIPLPIVLIFALLGIYRREDQPVETYLLAFFNFMLKPRRRVWSQEGYFENVRIVAPKPKAAPTVSRNPAEVHGQLEKLAQVIDTRGWAAKRPELTIPSTSSPLAADDDRLVMPEIVQEPLDIHQYDDMLDDSNPDAIERDSLIQASAARRHQQAMAQVQPQGQTGDPTGVQYNPYPASMHQQVLDPATGRLIHGDGSNDDNSQAQAAQTAQDNSVILELAENDDLSVSQIAAQAERRTKESGSIAEGEEVSLR